VTASIEGHKCKILHFNDFPYSAPDFKNITDAALDAILVKREPGTFAFRNTTELWIKERDRCSRINLEVRETAIGTLFNGLLFDELVREYSLGYSLWHYYKLNEPSDASRYCYYAMEQLILERNRPLYDARTSTFADH